MEGETKDTFVLIEQAPESVNMITVGQPDDRDAEESLSAVHSVSHKLPDTLPHDDGLTTDPLRGRGAIEVHKVNNQYFIVPAEGHNSEQAISRILENLPMLEILDETGRVSTLADLPSGSQIVVGDGFKGVVGEGSELQPAAQIVIQHQDDQREAAMELAATETAQTQITDDSSKLHLSSEQIGSVLQLLKQDTQHLGDSETKIEHNPEAMEHDEDPRLEDENEDYDEGRTTFSVVDNKNEWKWFRDSSGRKPSKYTCKVFDAVTATVSPQLLDTVRSTLDANDRLDGASLLERLLVTKHHVTDLMIREDHDELQLAGDLIDIMEVHNVLLGNIAGAACVHKPLQACSAVVRDQGTMCTGVPQHAPGCGGRKLKRLYTKDMCIKVPIPNDLTPASDPGLTSDTEPEIVSMSRPRTSGRLRRPPAKMESDVNELLDSSRTISKKPKRLIRKTSRRKISAEPVSTPQPAAPSEPSDPEPESSTQELTIHSAPTAETVSMPEAAVRSIKEPDENSVEAPTTHEHAESQDNLLADQTPAVENEPTPGTVLPPASLPGLEEEDMVGQPDLLTSGLGLLHNLKSELDSDMAPLASVGPLRAQTVDSFLPIITEDEPLLAEPLDDAVMATTATAEENRKSSRKKDYESAAPFKFFCKDCSFKTKRESHFHKHVLLHTEKNLPILRCTKCSYSTLHLSHLRHHEVLHTPNALKCVLCPYKTVSLQQMKKHHRVKHENKGVKLAFEQQCSHCDYKTDKLHLFQRHCQCHVHVNGNKSGVGGMLINTYTCTHCAYSSSKKENFLRHMENVHSQHRPHLCDLCGMGFKRKDTLKTHRLVHLEKSKRTYKFTCTQCNKGLRSKAHLDEHMSMHSAKREYLCEICGTSFKTRGIQRRHVYTIHTNPKAYTCEVCNKNFNTKFALQRHTRTHSEVLDKAGSLMDEDLQQASIIHIQPMAGAFHQDTSLTATADQVLQVLPSLDSGPALDDDPADPGQTQDQKVEVQIQPTLVQTSTGATTLLYLTTVPTDVTH